MESIPWWGWLLIVGGSLVALYYAIALVFFAKVSKRVFKTHDEVIKRSPWGDKDPFDDPFFKR